MRRHLNFINGTFAEPVQNKWLNHLSPATGEIEAEVAASGVLDIVRAIQAAHKAEADWKKLEPEPRAQILDKIAALLDERTGELARIQNRDQGSLVESAAKFSIPVAAAFFRESARWIRNESTRLSKETSHSGPILHRWAVGVVAIITPFTDPFVEIAKRVAPALAAGNAVILKPSEFAPACAEVFAELAQQAGLPAGVFNVVQGRGAEVGMICAQHPGLKVLSFTGSTETGTILSREAAENLKRVHLALGAQNACLIFQDVELDKTAAHVARLMSGFYPAVQFRVSRIFVQDQIVKAFTELLRQELSNLMLGPLAHPLLTVQFKSAVDLAAKENGKPLFHNDVIGTNGNRVSPQVSVDLTHCSTLQQTEVIGPFATLSSFKYQHDALKHANVGSQQLASYIFEKDLAKSHRVALKTEAKKILVNSYDAPTDFAHVAEITGEMVSFFSHHSTVN